MLENRKILIDMVVFFILISILFFAKLNVTNAASKKSANEFLTWYQEHKNDSSAVYTLTEDLNLTGGTRETPIKFDGTGDVEIHCGKYGIYIDGVVLFDQKKLKIDGTGDVIVHEYSSKSELILKNGSIYASNGGIAVLVTNGVIETSDKSTDLFQIEISGDDGFGIYCASAEVQKKDGILELSRLRIKVDGKNVRGIYNYYKSVDVILKHCKIESSGTGTIFGVLSEGNVSAYSSVITAKVTGEVGNANSISGLKVELFDSSVEPDVIENAPIYQILQIYWQNPVIQVKQEAIVLPETVKVQVSNQATGEKKDIELPVLWGNFNKTPQKGSYQMISGKLQINQMQDIYVNLKQLEPKIAVICPSETGMFLTGYEVVKQLEDCVMMKVQMPYPKGADSLKIYYSIDKKNWTLYSPWGEDNLIASGDPQNESGLLTCAFEVPIKESVFYMRAEVKGESAFSGTSDIWTIHLLEDSIPGIENDGISEGDRGGQIIVTNPWIVLEETKQPISLDTVSNKKEDKQIEKEPAKKEPTKKESTKKEMSSEMTGLSLFQKQDEKIETKVFSDSLLKRKIQQTKKPDKEKQKKKQESTHKYIFIVIISCFLAGGIYLGRSVIK